MRRRFPCGRTAMRTKCLTLCVRDYAEILDDHCPGIRFILGIGAQLFAYRQTIVWVLASDKWVRTFSLLPLTLSPASLNPRTFQT